jgi:hypothetical protein
MSEPNKQDFWRPNTNGPWFTVRLDPLKCQRCGKRATYRVVNSANATVGNYCDKDAAAVVREKRA